MIPFEKLYKNTINRMKSIIAYYRSDIILSIDL